MKQNVYNQSNTEVEEEFHVQERISHIIIAITSYKIYMAVCCHVFTYVVSVNVYNQSNTEVEEEFHVQERISHIIIAITSYKIYMAVCCHVFTYVVSVRIFRI